MTRVLIIEDSKRLAALLAEALGKRGFAADAAHSLASADDALAAARYDAVILDLGLPDGDGLKWLKQKGTLAPVLALTARGTLGDRVKGLDAGVDDYLTKPFAVEEVAARLRALLRRPGARAAPVLRVGDLELDVAARRASAGGVALDLSRRELDLLELLMRRAGSVVSKAAIETALYSFDAEVTPNAVEAAISRLRRRLGEAGVSGMLHTIRGVGYMLEDHAPAQRPA